MKQKRYLLDSTLRDGEQSPGLYLTSEQKIKIAALLDLYGVHQIEAGFPAMSKQEKEDIIKIIENRKNAVISVWSRLVPSDIELAIDTRPDIIHIGVPLDKDWVIDQLQVCLNLVNKSGISASVGFINAFHSKMEFMITIAKILLDFGVKRIRFADTTGTVSPSLCRRVLKDFSEKLEGKAELGIHAHNDLGMAVANTIEAAKTGCLYADVTVSGIGERAGNCDLAQLVHASSSIFDWGITAAVAKKLQKDIRRVL
jgi:homocitrate synthase NifV